MDTLINLILACDPVALVFVLVVLLSFGPISNFVLALMPHSTEERKRLEFEKRMNKERW
jgi:hypothetical protein